MVKGSKAEDTQLFKNFENVWTPLIGFKSLLLAVLNRRIMRSIDLNKCCHKNLQAIDTSKHTSKKVK